MKLLGYEFHDDVLRKMLTLTWQSALDDKERGFVLCGLEEHVTGTGRTRVGTESGVEIKGRCPPLTKQIGDFHTHPSLVEPEDEKKDKELKALLAASTITETVGSDPSPTDMLTALTKLSLGEGRGLDCRTGMGELRCDKVVSRPSDKQLLRMWMNYDIDLSAYDEIERTQKATSGLFVSETTPLNPIVKALKWQRP